MSGTWERGGASTSARDALRPAPVLALQSTKAVYDRILDLRIATPQIVINYAMFLEEHKYFEESFKVRRPVGGPGGGVPTLVLWARCQPAQAAVTKGRGLTQQRCTALQLWRLEA